MFQVWPPAFHKPVQIWALVSMASLHWDRPRGQRVEAPGETWDFQGAVWKVWKWTGSRVCQWRAGQRAVALLNIQQLPEIHRQRQGGWTVRWAAVRRRRRMKAARPAGMNSVLCCWLGGQWMKSSGSKPTQGPPELWWPTDLPDHSAESTTLNQCCNNI